MRKILRRIVQPAFPSHSYAVRMVLCAFVASFLAGWVRPAAPTTLPVVKDQKDRLDYVLVSVNGGLRVVKSGEELAVVRGDKLQIKEATLLGRGVVREVDVVGLPRSNSATVDDRGFVFSTKQLREKLSEGEAGTVYAVTAVGRKALHGVVYMRVVEPVLRFAEVSINGKRLVLRDGETLNAKTDDRVKVERVETNIEGSDDVIFQIVPAANGKDGIAAKNVGQHEIRFLRGEQVFARIPLTLSGG